MSLKKIGVKQIFIGFSVALILILSIFLAISQIEDEDIEKDFITAPTQITVNNITYFLYGGVIRDYFFTTSNPETKGVATEIRIYSKEDQPFLYIHNIEITELWIKNINRTELWKVPFTVDKFSKPDKLSVFSKENGPLWPVGDITQGLLIFKINSTIYKLKTQYMTIEKVY